MRRINKFFDIMTKKSRPIKISSIQTGVSGEYFVAAELARRGHIASITLKNTKGIDVLVANQSATRNLGIQVKTGQGKRSSWILSNKAEDFFDKNLFYVFVNLGSVDELPEYYIVPSKTVAAAIKKSHANWLITPGKKGQKHNDSSIRVFHDTEQKYKDRWDLLGL